MLFFAQTPRIDHIFHAVLALPTGPDGYMAPMLG
jgi:hypothetical protein